MPGRLFATLILGAAFGLAFGTPGYALQDEPESATSAAAANGEGLLGEIEQALGRLESLTAEFVQTSPEGTLHRGRLSLERPGRLRFDYTDETPLLLVSDGKVLTFVDYESGQVTRWPIEDTPLGLLVQEEIRLAGDERILDVRAEPDGSRVTLTAQDPDRPDDGTITLIFERDDSRLRLDGWRVLDGRGAVTRVRLHEMKRNAQLADSLWTFDDPRKLPSQRRRRSR